MKCIILANQSGTNQKAFTVLLKGYSPGLTKTGQSQVTITGKVDSQVGPVLREWKYVLKVLNDNSADPTVTYTEVAGEMADSPATYGTLSDLETFFKYGVGDNKLTMMDVDGTVHEVMLSGTIHPQPVTSQVTTYGIFHVPVILQKTTAVT
jgi:hypothetical protein